MHDLMAGIELGTNSFKGETAAGGKRKIKKILKFSTAELSRDFTGSAEIHVTELCTPADRLMKTC
jgi:hypothetical protein